MSGQANPFDTGFYREDELRQFGFKRIGINVQIAKTCTVVGLENIAIGDNVRIDGYCTLVAAGTVTLVLILIAFVAGRAPRLIPGRVQNFFELIFEFLLDYMENVFGSRAAAVRFFPLIVTIFLFIALSNLFDFLPFFGSVGLYRLGEFIPFYRPVKKQITLRLDADVIAWLRVQGKGYQTKANALLRNAMVKDVIAKAS